MQSLQCHACGAVMSGSSFDRRLGVVVCDHCGAMFDLTRRSTREAVPPPSLHASTPPPDERAPVALPERFSVSRRGRSSLTVQWRWFQPFFAMLMGFALLWLGIIATWYHNALQVPGAPMAAFVVPLLHLGVGIGLGYYGLAGLLNHTKLTCTQGMLKVRHGPLPWFPQPTIRVRDLEQLYVERKVHHHKKTTTVTWNLLAVTRDHRGLPVVNGLDSPQQALWLEQEIEEMLDIRDRPVAGEYRGEGLDRV